MRKTDLENGMVVKFRNGRKAVVFKDCALEDTLDVKDFFLGGSFYIRFNCFNDDLTYKKNSAWDVIKVYCQEDKEDYFLTLLWEREKAPEIKLTENERDLLETLYNMGLRWMARDWDEVSINFFEKKPANDEGKWNLRIEGCDMFSFMTVEDEEPYNIEEVLGD